jgi:hypothetical protein
MKFISFEKLLVKFSPIRIFEKIFSFLEKTEIFFGRSQFLFSLDDL